MFEEREEKKNTLHSMAKICLTNMKMVNVK